MEEKRIISVCFVNDSGSRKEAWLGQKKLPFIVAWPLFKNLYSFLGITIVFRGLKEETIERFEMGRHIIVGDLVYKLFVSGCYEGNPEAPNVNEKYFLDRGIPPDKICAEGLSLDTRGNIREFLFYLKKHYPDPVLFWIYLVDAPYRYLRTLALLEELASEKKIAINVLNYSVRPKLTWQSFIDDYAFNVLSEKLKRLMDRHGIRKVFLDAWRKTKKKF